ncbi:MAG: hypothetical protein ACLFM7_13765 [Bacteroidales bacterium]
MKTLNLLITALLFIIVPISTIASNPEKDLPGEWKFDVRQAPYEYQKGKMIIEQSDEQLKGKVVFERAQDVTIREIDTGKEKISITLYIQGEKVQLTGNIEGKKFVGYAKTNSQDKIDFLAEKVINEG